MCCHGVQPSTEQQEETQSFHLSLNMSTETQSDDWDSPAQVELVALINPSRVLIVIKMWLPVTLQLRPAAVPLGHMVDKDLAHLMDAQVQLDDQVYSQQLDCTLLRGEGGASEDQGYWTLPVEQVLPLPEHIPASFKGKSWAQIEQEDEQRVDTLVQQFRRGRFICYFDSESLAR